MPPKRYIPKLQHIAADRVLKLEGEKPLTKAKERKNNYDVAKFRNSKPKDKAAAALMINRAKLIDKAKKPGKAGAE